MAVKHSLFSECQMVLSECMQYWEVSCRLPALRIDLHSQKKDQVSMCGKTRKRLQRSNKTKHIIRDIRNTVRYTKLLLSILRAGWLNMATLCDLYSLRSCYISPWAGGVLSVRAVPENSLGKDNFYLGWIRFGWFLFWYRGTCLDSAAF